MQFFAFEKLAHSVHPVRSERANGAAVEPHAAGARQVQARVRAHFRRLLFHHHRRS